MTTSKKLLTKEEAEKKIKALIMDGLLGDTSNENKVLVIVEIELVVSNVVLEHRSYFALHIVRCIATWLGDHVSKSDPKRFAKKAAINLLCKLYEKKIKELL